MKLSNPIEFAVIGRPASVNAGTQNKNNWKAIVANAAKNAISSTYIKNGGEVEVKIFFYPENNQYIDIDNGLKYTIDGFAELLIVNDRNVTRIISERFPCNPGASVVVPINAAVSVLNALRIQIANPKNKEHVTAVKLEDYICNNGGHW